MLLAMILMFAVQPSQDPLAPAASGMLQCYTPNVEARTCRAMAAYRPNSAGGYDNTAIVLAASDPVAILETVSQVIVREGAVCGFLRREDIVAGSLRIDGELLADRDAAPLLERIASALAALEGQEICTTYIPSGDHLIARATVGGSSMGPDDIVIWVSPQDGYRVAP